MIQKTLTVGPFQCNCQILVCEKTGDTLLVDPGDDAKTILSVLKKTEQDLKIPLKLKGLLHTHAHLDHIGATRAVKEERMALGESPLIYLHKDDEFIYTILKKQGEMFGIRYDDPLPVNHFLKDEEELQFGTLKFQVIHTPGHSPGGVCFRLKEDLSEQVPEIVFSGDTLFKESVGRSDLWGGDGALLKKSIKERLLTLDGDTVVWPGHGESTRMGHEKRSNPFL